ncbi:MAG: invasion protein A [Monoraphidium minutum]|nr:MAG: invasion protein A [Monoraphidium minutum]
MSGAAAPRAPRGGAAGRAAALAAEAGLPEALRDYRPNVGMCVVNAEGKVFAARRLDDPNPDSWQMPQGGIDPGEAPLQAAVRELQEEVSIISVELVGEIQEWVSYDFPTEVRSRFTGEWARFRGQAQRWFLFRFTGPDSEVDLETDHAEFSEWRWMDLGELPAKVIPFKRGVYEVVAAQMGAKIGALRDEGRL